jgi:hypothetical protein
MADQALYGKAAAVPERERLQHDTIQVVAAELIE